MPGCWVSTTPAQEEINKQRDVLVEREVDMWWVEVCISQIVPSQHLKLTDIEQENV